MIVVLPIEIAQDSDQLSRIMGMFGRNMSRLLLTTFVKAPSTGAAMMMNLEDVYRKSISQELEMMRVHIRLHYPGTEVQVDPAYDDNPQQQQLNPNQMVSVLLANQPVDNALDWLNSRGLKGGNSVWLVSWNSGKLPYQPGFMMHFKTRELRHSGLPGTDMNQESLKASEILGGVALEPESREQQAELGLLRWKFNGHSPASLHKLVCAELDDRDVVLTHLLPDITHSADLYHRE
jgi:hypothetical protein